jgi:plastocyanin
MRSTKALIGLVLLAQMLTVGCGKGASNSANPSAPTPAPVNASPADVTITIGSNSGAQSFAPSPAAVKVGQTVAWRNADAISHTATADSSAFDTGTIAPGATSAPITMRTAGSFGYHCQFHPSMVGTMNVTQ